MTASYATVHHQLRRTRGRASEYRCQLCPSPATQWAYDHKDPDECMGVFDSTGRLAPYSLDPAHYLPLCKPCHTHLDKPPPRNRASRGLPSPWDPRTYTWDQGEWRRTRDAVLERDGYTCQLRTHVCTGIATLAHHTRDRLVYGDDPAYLVAACKPCNISVHDPTKPRPAPARVRAPRTEQQRERRRDMYASNRYERSTTASRNPVLPTIQCDPHSL